MSESSQSFRLAVVQATPVYLNHEATVAKARELIGEAGKLGADLAVFPEAFIPGYPLWVWFVPPGRTRPMRELYSELHANAVTVPSDATESLCEAAKKANIHVVMGINERNAEASDSSLFNTCLYIGANGDLLGKHRKLIPTGGERLVWAQGDGSDLEVYDLPFGRVSALLCWENYMPLARYALCAQGLQILAAPTWDRGEPWLSTLRHVAKECRSFVLGCCSPMRKSDIPDRFSFKDEYLSQIPDWINPGDSAIVDPDGKFLAGPAQEEETILLADVDTGELTGSRFQLDVAGHYARPDVFELVVHRRPRPMLRTIEHPIEEPDQPAET